MVLGTIMWLVLTVVLHGPAQQSSFSVCPSVVLKIVLLSRFQPEALNLPPGEKGGCGGRGTQRKKGVVCECRSGINVA